MKKLISRLGIIAALAAMSGCATIIGHPTQEMPISSVPSDALVVITDEQGTETHKASTPTTVTLTKSTGRYWGKKSYLITISKPGFQPQTIPVTASANGWYLGGNFLFGGLIGWFIVDPLNGHMYKLSPQNINASMSATAAHNNTATDGSIAIMLLEDVPADLIAKMERIY
jgi:hypothetical protein